MATLDHRRVARAPRDPASMLWRAARTVEPDDRARSAGLFISAYIAVVLLFVAGVSQLIEAITV